MQRRFDRLALTIKFFLKSAFNVPLAVLIMFCISSSSRERACFICLNVKCRRAGWSASSAFFLTDRVALCFRYSTVIVSHSTHLGSRILAPPLDFLNPQEKVIESTSTAYCSRAGPCDNHLYTDEVQETDENHRLGKDHASNGLEIIIVSDLQTLLSSKIVSTTSYLLTFEVAQ
ncbi:MAG: hypothetical protein J3R72DRAFT_454374 [Linnemannia gamsii]|nr:MAG: hypothetical protein J3R72DRAFT_454374 [Linnemannia gamsii]